MTLTKRALLGATALAFAGIVPAVAQSAPTGRLVLSSPQDPGSWDPIDTFLVNWASVATNIFDGLTYRDPDGKIVPGLATGWEEAADGKSIRFKLRPGVKFHNGEAFDADAVKFTFERLLGPEGAKGPQQANYTAIASVEVIDDLTVEMRLKAADPVLLTKLAGYGAMIVPPGYLKEKGDAYFNTHPVGTGPFRLVSYEPKGNVRLAAFAESWSGVPKLAEVEYRFIAEPATAVAELQAGRVDVVIPPTIPVGMVPTIQANPKLSLAATAGPTVYALRYNTRTGITKDAKVRKALILAVDRATIIKTILAGQAEPVASFQSKLSFGYDPSLKPLPYDPAAARALLKEAGVAPGAAVQIDVRGSDATFSEVAQAVSAYLGAVGIMASIKPYEVNVLLNDIVPAGKTGAMFQQTWGGWTLDYDNTAYAMYHTGQKWNPYTSDPKLDALLESQRSLTDAGKRLDILRAIGRTVFDESLEMPLYNLNAIYALNKRVKDFVPAPDNRLRLTEVTVD